MVEKWKSVEFFCTESDGIENSEYKWIDLKNMHAYLFELLIKKYNFTTY